MPCGPGEFPMLVWNILNVLNDRMVVTNKPLECSYT